MPYIKDRAPFDVMIDGLIKRTRGYDRQQMRQVVANISVYSLTRFPAPCSLDDTVNGIIRDLGKRVKVRGDVNYILCRVVLESMKPEAGWSYHSLSDVISVLESAVDLAWREISSDCNDPTEEEEMSDVASVCYDAADEIKRRLLGPYEDTAIRKNGDMDCFDETFAYLPPIEAEFDQPCGPDCQCKLPPITEALTPQQIDNIGQKAQYRDPSQPPPSATPRNLGQ